MRRAPLSLTDALVASLKPPRRGEVELQDAQVPALRLRLRAGGAKTWTLRRHKDGARRRVTLGDAGSLPAEAAREAARAILAGEAPPARRAGERFDAFALRHRDRMAARWKPSTLAGFDSSLRRHLLPAFGRLPLAAIDAAAVARWFFALSQSRPGAANRNLALLRAVLNAARARGALPAGAPDPCAPIRPNRRPPRWRILSVEEIARLGRALGRMEREGRREAAAIRLLLLTGCRRGEVLALRWRAVGEAALAIEDAKAGPRAQPLSKPARAVLDRLRGAESQDPDALLFPDPARPGRPLRHLDAPWAEAKARAGLPETLRLHDLRHSYASRAVMMGESLHATGKLLGHRRRESTERYAHFEARHLRDAADRVAARVEAMMNGG